MIDQIILSSDQAVITKICQMSELRVSDTLILFPALFAIVEGNVELKDVVQQSAIQRGF